MDMYSHQLANRLVGNDGCAATLEVTLMGPTITFEGPASFAVTGGAFALELDGVPISMNSPIATRHGGSLRFGARSKGARAYIAISGGVQVPEVFNSRSTHLLTRMGGHQGRALRSGDRLEIGIGGALRSPVRLQPLSLLEGGARLRVIPEAMFELVSGFRFQISTRSDRMGYRLDGKKTEAGSRAELLSKPVTAGAVQIPPSGEPILLMADHATAGGYPVAAVVISADLPAAGQLAPGDWIEFVPCTLDEADDAFMEQQRALAGS
jgi:antagonist of KipI